MNIYDPRAIEFEKLQRTLYSLCNNDPDLQKAVPMLDSRWVIARSIARWLLDRDRER